MTKKELAEIRRRLQPDKNAIENVHGCYVSQKGQVIASFSRPLVTLPEQEVEKYFALFKRVLSGESGKNQLDIAFRPDQVMEEEAHRLLTALNRTGLKAEEGLQALYQKVIESVHMESNYVILLVSDAYDLPRRSRDGARSLDDSEEVFTYILCCVCPVKPTKPCLSYYDDVNEFHDSEPDWAVSAPEMGFMFPSFDDRTTNIYNALYYTRNAEDAHEDFVSAVFDAEITERADEQKAHFEEVLVDSLGEAYSMEVAQHMHNELRELIEQHKKDKREEPLTVNRHDVSAVLEGTGVPEEQIQAFEEKYDQEFGFGACLSPDHLINPKKFEVRLPDVVIQVNPEKSDMLETRVIDGVKYLLIRADEGVQVNGIDIGIDDGEE